MEQGGEEPKPSDDKRGPSRAARARTILSQASERLLLKLTEARALASRHLRSETQVLFALTLLIGAVCGLVAVLFHLAIQGVEELLIERALRAPGKSWMVWTIVSPTAGGLLAGIALKWLVPGARGSGIPQVKQAFATEGGRVRFRDALGKFLIGALQIGSGASLGREGPTVQICAGATSLLARLTSLPPRNMRRLTPVGVAAGIAAAFNAPIAAVTFTIEEIVGTLDQAVLSGVVVAAALAAVIEREILGVHPVIQVHQTYGLTHASSLLLYALLGLVAAALSVVFTDGLLKLRLWFRNLKVLPVWAQPALGGLVTGGLAVLVLWGVGTTGIQGGGYETLGLALEGNLGLQTLVLLCGAKLIATVFSYASGGAGGIFAPSLFVGAMAGGAVGYLDVEILGSGPEQLGAFALVGMGAVFAGVVRAPITSVLIIFEMTGGYGLVLPLMLANMISYVLARRMRPVPIYEALLLQDGIELPEVNPGTPHTLEVLKVADAMVEDVVSASADATVADAVWLTASHSFALLPVVENERHLRGVIPLRELSTLPPVSPLSRWLRPAQTISKSAPLVRAMVRMNDVGARQLFVVDGAGRLTGVVSIADVVRVNARVVRSLRSRTSVAQLLPPPELRARNLMEPAIPAAPSDGVFELVERLRAGAEGLFVVTSDEGSYSVVLTEHLGELLPEEDMLKMLIAADVAVPASEVSEDADLRTLARALPDEPHAAVVIVSGGIATGVVTRTALANALLDWYASQLIIQPTDREGARLS